MESTFISKFNKVPLGLVKKQDGGSAVIGGQ
jgi:hypothetical protein